MLHALDLVCTVLGAVLLYTLVVGSLVAVVLQRLKRLRPSVVSPATDRRALHWPRVPEWVARDRGWAVSVVLLGAPDLAEQTKPYVDFHARRIDWQGLRLEAGTWPRHEQLIVDIAHDLASGGVPSPDDDYPGEPVLVSDLLVGLDQPHLELVHAAVDLRRGTRTLPQAQQVADRLAS